RVVVAMALECRDHILRGQVLAVVEGHALAELEGPDLGVWRGAVFLGELQLDAAIRRQVEQLLTPTAAERIGYLACPAAGIQTIGSAAADHAGLQRAALDGSLRGC